MNPSSRRRFLGAAIAGATTGLAGCAQSTEGGTGQESGGGGSTGTSGSPETTGTSEPASTDGSSGSNFPRTVGLETLASGMEAPLDVAFAPDADRRYVADQSGVVYVHESEGLRDEPFLDLRDSIEYGGEKGLLGFALHPDFVENRLTYVRYTSPSRSGTPSNYSHTFVLAEFEATADGLRATPDSERALLEIPEPQGNHNAGDIAFGPDGYLYAGVGDGGAGGDQGPGHVDDWYDAVDGGNGQDVTENLLGSVLRIDVNSREGDRPYGIPDDNPLVGTDGLDEHYAWGFRNPWRLSFDLEGSRGGDGADLYVADVGQSGYEEVSLVERGGNYGWNVREGAHCYSASDCPTATPGSVRGGEPLIDPIVEYPHSGGGVSGVSIIGGYVYRGSALPGLTGTYVFADLSAEGRLFAASPGDGGGTWPIEVIEVAGDDAGKIQRVYSFGRDPDGELYVLGIGSDGGGLHRVVPAA